MKYILFGGKIFNEENALDGEVGILLEDDVIKAIDAVDHLIRLEPDAQKINVNGRTILPGMIDCHRHLISSSDQHVSEQLLASGMIDGVKSAALSLQEGVTYVRDPGCRHYGIFYLRDAINSGQIDGPGIFAAGPNPTSDIAPKSWRNVYIHDPWTMRQAVRRLKRDGADWIKVIVTGRSSESGWKFTQRYLTLEELSAAADEAHAMGYRISGHIEAPEGTQLALDAGFDAIDHGTGITVDQAKEMAARGVFYIPTLSFLHYNDIDSVWGPLPDEIKKGIEDYRLEHAQSFRNALLAGVKIAAGTDYAGNIPPKHCLVEELKLMVQNGMQPYHAILAATANAADLMGKGEYLGKIKPGYQADLIAVDGDPLQNLDSLKQVDLVVKSGKVVISKL